MRKIAISLNKGGVGKSSSAVNIAHGLALQGKKVLLIDTDDQGHLSILLGVKPEKGLAHVINEECTVTEALFKARPNLWLLAGGKMLSGVKRSIGRKDYAGEQTLANALKPIEDKFDYVIIDTSPSWDTLTVNALFYANEVLTPVSVELLTVNSLIEFIKSINSVKTFNENLNHNYVLPTFLDGRVKKSKEIYEQLKEQFMYQIIPPIHYNVRVSESVGYGETIFEHAPTSSGAQDYKSVVERIMEDDQEKRITRYVHKGNARKQRSATKNNI